MKDVINTIALHPLLSKESKERLIALAILLVSIQEQYDRDNAE